ncbi:MAG: ABC transporter permease [Acidilobaceae archaeon]|nr:ABC transporter permease [Acidilobaceae archaeon]
MVEAELWLFVLISSLSYMTPILLATIGEIITERSGIVNVGIEGILLSSAFASVATSFFSGSMLLGVLAGTLAGALLGALFGLFAVYLRADQIIAGLAINMASYGFTVLGLIAIWGHHGASPRVEGQLPYFSIGQSTVPLLTLLAILIAVLSWFFLFRTRTGLALRACGEEPRAADAMGVNTYRYRIAATTLGGTLAGLGGAFLALEIAGVFTRGMSAGMGFIALANVAFSGWNPLPAVFGAYVFGFLSAAADALQQEVGYAYLLKTLPYLGTLAVTVLTARRSRAPLRLGVPYARE